jgi:RNA polymerase sigma factor (TIGR02999 family)
MTNSTDILSVAEQGDPQASDQLLPLVYEELRKLAAHKLAQEKPGQTLQATALVHEAYLRLVVQPLGAEGRKEQSWSSRGHFFAAAAEAMRRILVEQARHKGCQKAGGGRQRLELSKVDPEAPTADDDLLALDEALDKLAAKDPRKAQLVKLRFFAGLTVEQAAEMLGVSPSTARDDWAYARCWLRLEIMGNNEDGQASKP